MVIKTLQMSTFEAAKWIAAATVISSFIWTIGGFIVLTVWSLYKDDIIATAGLATREDFQQLESTLSQAATSFATLSRQIIVLSRPDNVVLYREPPKPVLGNCTAGETCRISIFAERTQRALECRVLGEKTELLILRDGREYVASPVIERPATNLQGQPRALEPQFTLPRGVPAGPSTAIIRSHYTDCTWQLDGDPPVIQDSPTFDLNILPSKEAIIPW